MTSFLTESGASAATPMLASDASAPAQLQQVGAARWNALSRLRQRWLQFQQRQVSRCRVFVIPCVAMRGAGGGGEAAFVLARPTLDFRWLGPLRRLADAHPRFYIGFILIFLAMPNFALFLVIGDAQAKGISNTIINSIMCIMMFGYMCSKINGLDRVAVKHVALSFRFAIIVALLATDTALSIRRVYINGSHPATCTANAVLSMLCCMCILLDCSPHLPPSVQIYVSVSAHNVRIESLFADHLCRLDGACTTDIPGILIFWIFNDYPPVAIEISIVSSISERTRFATPLRGSPFSAACFC
jgi:hypothetical protein